MVWIQKLRKGLKTRKVKLFFIFLACSFLAWFISNLSETYTSNAVFDLNFVNIPENKMLIKASKERVDVKLQAVGFQFLGFNFKNKVVDINISAVEEENGRFFIRHEAYRKQIEKQLSISMQVLEMDSDTMYFDFKEVITKEVMVDPKIKMEFAQNYLLDGNLEIDPSTITITGPKEELSAISSISTVELILDNLTTNFTKTIRISEPKELVNSIFSSESITISGSVAKFSEKIIEVPVLVTGVPKATAVRTFPEKVQVLCKAKLSDLKRLNDTDFKVIADFDEIAKNTGSNRVSIRLIEEPDQIYGATLIENNVEYILKIR